MVLVVWSVEVLVVVEMSVMSRLLTNSNTLLNAFEFNE
jgi:hypothetical protein